MIRSISGLVRYTLSLPERLVRAAVGLVGGALLAVLDVLLPQALRSTTVYRILFGDSLRFALERIAGVTPARETLPPLPRNFQARKMAGTAIESLGLLAVQFSPLWVFAIAGDAAAGSKLFLRRLEGHLKNEGVIDAGVEVRGLVDLLDALQRASRATAAMIDTPPLSRADLEAMAVDIRSAFQALFVGTTDLIPRLDRIWLRMEQMSAESGLSVGALAGYMARSSRSLLARSRGTMRALGRTGSDLAGEHVLQGYTRTLDELAEGGGRAFLQVRMQPYLLAVRELFTADHRTWTEKAIARLVGRTRLD